MKAGDLAIADLPVLGGGLKRRPVVLLCEMPPFQDWLVCGVTTQLRHEVVGLDDIVRANDPDFPASGLKAESLIRLGFVATLSPAEIVAQIGALAPARHRQLLSRLANHLISTPIP